MRSYNDWHAGLLKSSSGVLKAIFQCAAAAYTHLSQHQSNIPCAQAVDMGSSPCGSMLLCHGTSQPLGWLPVLLRLT